MLRVLLGKEVCTQGSNTQGLNDWTEGVGYIVLCH